MSRVQTSSGIPATGTSTPAQINAQSLSQDWKVYSGVLYIYTSITLNSYTLTIDATATVRIN